MESKFKQNDHIDVRNISHDEFIQLHQSMEDNDEPLYESTSYRKVHNFGYSYLRLSTDNKGVTWHGSNGDSIKSTSKVYTPEEMINTLTNNQTYEIY